MNKYLDIVTRSLYNQRRERIKLHGGEVRMTVNLNERIAKWLESVCEDFNKKYTPAIYPVAISVEEVNIVELEDDDRHVFQPTHRAKCIFGYSRGTTGIVYTAPVVLPLIVDEIRFGGPVVDQNAPLRDSLANFTIDSTVDIITAEQLNDIVRREGMEIIPISKKKGTNEFRFVIYIPNRCERRIIATHEEAVEAFERELAQHGLLEEKLTATALTNGLEPVEDLRVYGRTMYLYTSNDPANGGFPFVCTLRREH